MELSLQRGAIPVELDRTRILFFDHAATWLLVQKFGPAFLTKLYRVKDKNVFELVDMDALAFFLFAGLQRDAKQHGEDLTLEQAQEFLRPWTYTLIFHAVIFAAVGATASPALPGKAAADASAAEPPAPKQAAPSHPGPTKVTTSTKRSASPSRSSAGRKPSSGRRR
ncbi:MAG TPA: hypothetical protein VLI45_09220 [Acidobacteriaceae bacterium]|nr:hypothetical protein [Acidobacteriaceae bacterium]